MAERLRKGDTVQVIAGKNRGVQGRILSVDQRKGAVIVERANVVKRHQKPGLNFRQGGILEKEAPIHISNVMLLHKGERTRVGFRFRDGKKVRWSLRHDEAIDA
jgi:large subunit ribosomal protein L24